MLGVFFAPTLRYIWCYGKESPTRQSDSYHGTKLCYLLLQCSFATPIITLWSASNVKGKYNHWDTTKNMFAYYYMVQIEFDAYTRMYFVKTRWAVFAFRKQLDGLFSEHTC